MNERHPSDVAAPEPSRSNSVRVRRIGLGTQYEAIVFMRKDCQVCGSEGLSAYTRVLLCNGKRRIIATLYQVTSDLIDHTEAGLSESAWFRLGLKEGDSITVTHPEPLDSLSLVRSRIYGHDLTEPSLNPLSRMS
jgi:thymidine phosphorylase